jgi:hypothetical protein
MNSFWKGDPMRFLLAFFIVSLCGQMSRSDEASPLAGLDGVQFSLSVDVKGDVVVSQDRLARLAEDALKKAGILRKGENASAYPQLSLAIHGRNKQNVVIFVWELQLKEKVEIPANKSYRRKAYHGQATILQLSGMMSTDTAKMELELMAQIENSVNAFIKQWQKANPADAGTDKIQETKK